MTASLFGDWFGWPDGAVLTNLVASGICAVVVVRRLLKEHRKIHEKLDRIHKHLGIEE